MQQNSPFYVPYPMQMQSNYLSDMEYEKDLERMKELYPQEAKEIQRYVEEECDRMEYEGSMMYDEYPDKVMLRKICQNIMDRIQQDQSTQEIESSECCGEEEMARGPRPPRRPRPPRGDGLSDLIEVLLYNEMYKRRCRHRRCNRWW
ncbi:MAG: hypothetical protein SPK14_02610 [Lachnospiraceae bacterium]|nr:hypothetical protein [Lachnospiraceae bacterium]